MKPFIKISLFILLILSQINTIMEQDIWLHLRVGEYIFKNLTIPTRDLFSYTVLGRPWINHEWLAQLFFYLIQKGFGFIGLTFLKVALVFLTFFIIFKLCHRKTSLFVSVLFLVLSVLAFSYRSQIRPELFSYFFFASYFYILEKYRNREGDLIIFLPVLQILWTNTHGYFILGIVLSLIYFLQRFIKKDSKAAFVFVLILVSTLINPNFLKGAVYPFQTLIKIFTTDVVFKRNISELQMPASFSFGRFLFFWILIFLTLTSFILNLKKAKAFYLLVFLFCFVLSYSSLRDMPYLAILAAPVAANNLNFLSFKKNRWTEVLSLALIIFCIILFVSNKFYSNESEFRGFGLGLREFCKGAADFIRDADLKGNLFNSYNFGGYLIYRFYPEKKVFVDGRTELFGTRIYRLCQAAQYYPSAWMKLVSEYNINFCVLQHMFTGPEALIRRLYKDRNWALIYFDRYTAIFIKEAPQNSEIIKRFRVDLNSIKDQSQYADLNIAKFLEIIEEWDAAESVYNNILKKDTTQYRASNALGVLLLRKGKTEEAYKILKETLVQHKDNPETLHSLGLIMLNLGRRSDALEYFYKALRFDRNFRFSYYFIGKSNFDIGDFQTAKRFFKRYLDFDPYNSSVRYYLGTIALRERDFDKAVSELKEAILLSPEDRFSHNNLAVAYVALNKKAEAEAEWKKTLEISPAFRSAKENLKRLEQNR